MYIYIYIYIASVPGPSPSSILTFEIARAITRNGEGLVTEEVAISDHEMWVWSEFIHGVCHSHWMGTVAKELRRIEL